MISWKIEVKPTTEKYYLKLDKNTRTKMMKALRELENTDDPLLHPNVRALTEKLRGDFRLRVGKLRVLFTPHIEKKILYVFVIVPRGDAY